MAGLPVLKLRDDGGQLSRFRREDGWLVAFAVLLFFSFPHPVGDFVLDGGAWLSWFAVATLLLGIRDLTPKAAAKRALLAGWAANAAILHWFYIVTVVYGHAPPAVGVLATLGVGFGVACFVAVFAAGCRVLARSPAWSPFAPALLWTAIEHLRTVFPVNGFPWALLGYAQHQNEAMLGLATITGVYGLSFVTVLGGAVVAAVFESRLEARPIPVRVMLAAAAVFVALGVGWFARPGEAPDAPRLRIAAIQGNVDQGVKWSPGRADEIIARYADASRAAAEQGARVILWPETAVPGALEFDPSLEQTLRELARETHAVLVVGGVGIAPLPEGRAGYHFFDSAFVFAADGTRAGRYDKTHLVPFGEYIPLRSWIGRFVGAVATGIAPGDVTPGAAPRAVELPLADSFGAVRVGLPICYELLFPDLVRRFALDGGQVLLAITNDAWYGRTGAPYQFLAMTALRSAETGLWTVRAANTGVSAVIDARGVVQEQTDIFEPAVLVSEVPLLERASEGTFYVRHGNVFAWACWIGVAVLWAWAKFGVGARAAEEGPRDE